MSDINFDQYGNEEFFKLFLAAVKETYGEYCTFKEHEENLTEYSEPVFEKSIEEAENRLASVEQQLAKANERVKELERELKESDDDLCVTQQKSSKYESALEEVKAIFTDNDACPIFETFDAKNLSNWLNKFAIENQVKGAKDAFIAGYQYALKPVTSMRSYNQMLEQAECYSEQLRKEQLK